MQNTATTESKTRHTKVCIDGVLRHVPICDYIEVEIEGSIVPVTAYHLWCHFPECKMYRLVDIGRRGNYYAFNDNAKNVLRNQSATMFVLW